MRTAKQKKPDDPKCRDWNAREKARRAKQPGFEHQVGDSINREVEALAFRLNKAARRPAQQEADKREAERQKAAREEAA